MKASLPGEATIPIGWLLSRCCVLNSEDMFLVFLGYGELKLENQVYILLGPTMTHQGAMTHDLEWHIIDAS